MLTMANCLNKLMEDMVDEVVLFLIRTARFETAETLPTVEFTTD